MDKNKYKEQELQIIGSGYTGFQKQLAVLIFIVCIFCSMQTFYYWLVRDQFYFFVFSFGYLSQAFDIYLKMEHGKK